MKKFFYGCSDFFMAVAVASLGFASLLFAVGVFICFFVHPENHCFCK